MTAIRNISRKAQERLTRQILAGISPVPDKPLEKVRSIKGGAVVNKRAPLTAMPDRINRMALPTYKSGDGDRGYGCDRVGAHDADQCKSLPPGPQAVYPRSHP